MGIDVVTSIEAAPSPERCTGYGSGLDTVHTPDCTVGSEGFELWVTLLDMASQPVATDCA